MMKGEVFVFMENLRRKLAERRKYRTGSDFELLFSEDWISDIDDLELLDTLVLRCCKEKGLSETNKLLSSNEKVMSKLSKVNPELAYRVRTSSLLGEFVLLDEDILKELSNVLKGLKGELFLLGVSGTCTIEDDDGIVLLKYFERGLVQTHMLGEGFNQGFNDVLESTIIGLIHCIPQPIKRLYFSVENDVVGGYMFSSEEEGSYEIHLEN